MVFKRNLEVYLLTWKESLHRKPLVLRGARQVGKTTLINSFSSHFDQFISLNLEKRDHREYFDDTDDIQIIANKIFLSQNKQLEARQKTLLFIDEIQESPKAMKSLRYFYEEIPELAVITAGSLLEFAIKDIQHFPVGRIEYAYLHPFSFDEYLAALGYTDLLSAYHTSPLASYAHSTLLQKFNEYTITGGMPEIVQRLGSEAAISDLVRTYESIWTTYQEDILKYSTNESTRKVIRHILSTAHLYLDQRIKMQNFGNSNYRSREVGEAFRLLEQARILQLIYPTTEITPPIKPKLNKSPRIQFLDTGIVNHALGIQGDMLGSKNLQSQYRGGIIPHIVTQELISLGSLTVSKPNFWVRDKNQSSAEVDLVYRYKDYILPIEIKSGAVGKLRSLHQFVDRSPHSYAIRMYAGEFTIEEHTTPNRKRFILMNLPYYLGARLEQYIEYFLENH